MNAKCCNYPFESYDLKIAKTNFIKTPISESYDFYGYRIDGNGELSNKTFRGITIKALGFKHKYNKDANYDPTAPESFGTFYFQSTAQLDIFEKFIAIEVFYNGKKIKRYEYADAENSFGKAGDYRIEWKNDSPTVQRLERDLYRSLQGKNIVIKIIQEGKRDCICK